MIPLIRIPSQPRDPEVEQAVFDYIAEKGPVYGMEVERELIQRYDRRFIRNAFFQLIAEGKIRIRKDNQKLEAASH